MADQFDGGEVSSVERGDCCFPAVRPEEDALTLDFLLGPQLKENPEIARYVISALFRED
jgi:hypothetical protein